MLANIFKKGARLGWYPDADELNAPDGTLLRATNTVLDVNGAITKRQGYANLYTGLTDSTGLTTNVHSLYSAVIDDDTYIAAGCDDNLYITSSATIGTAKALMAGTGDFAFGDDSYHMFIARGSSKYMWDGTHLYDWSLNTPPGAPTVAAGSIVQTVFMNFGNSTDTAVPAGSTATITVHEGTRSYETGHDTTANGASEMSPDTKTGRASLSKVWTADQDCKDILNRPGSDTDLINIYVYLEDVKKFERIRLMFGLGTGTDPFKDDYYAFDFEIDDGTRTLKIKDPLNYSKAAFDKAAADSQAVLNPEDVTQVRNPVDVSKVLQRVRPGIVSKARADSSQASPAWTHFMVARGQFERVGNTESRDWSTVRGFKVVYQGVPGSTAKCRFDEMSVVGGGNTVLIGDFRFVYRFVYDTGQYQQLGPCSPMSDPVTLNMQPVTITIPNSSLLTKNSQVNQIWLYMYGGLLDRFYRVATFGDVGTSRNWSLDEFSAAADGSPDSTLVVYTGTLQAGTGATSLVLNTDASASNDYYKDMYAVVYSGTGAIQEKLITAYVGATKTATVGTMNPVPVATDKVFISNLSLSDSDKSSLRIGMALEMGLPGAGSSSLAYKLQKSEMEILTDNVILEPGAVGVPDDIVAIAGPWLNRMFNVTSEGFIWPTSNISPANGSVYHVLDGRRYGTPLWAVTTVQGVYIGFTKDIVVVVGDGTVSADGSAINLYLQPLSVGNPPLDAGVYTDGSSIVYQSADGLMQLSGSTVTVIPKGGTNLLWRGQTRHDVSPLNLTTGRFRVAVDNQILYMTASEGADTTPGAVWRFNSSKENPDWSRHIYYNATDILALLSLHRIKTDGRLIAGTDTGAVITLESGANDGTTSVPVDILWPWQEGDHPLARKVPNDFFLHVNTGGSLGTLTFMFDDATTSTYTFETSGVEHWRGHIDDASTFFHIQPRITGSFSSFEIQEWCLSYRPLVQHMMTVDTDYILPPGDSDIIWMQELEVDCISPSDLTAYVYIDDTLYTTQTVTVTANKRSVYLVPLPRGTKGRRPRVRFSSTAAHGSGEIGFELFRVRYRSAGTGNMYEIGFQSASPTGGA